MPMCAWPASFIIEVTSAKSRLMNAGMVISSVTELTPWRRTSSAISNALARVSFCSETYLSLSLGITISESTCCASSAIPASACFILCAPSNAKGFVTMPTVRIPFSFAISAIMGAAPVPVPPPIPAVTNTICVPLRASMIASLFSSADFWPISGFAPAPLPEVTFSPIWIFCSASERARACLSVLIAIRWTPLMPALPMRLIAFPPPPPTPITLMLVISSYWLSISNAIFNILLCMENFTPIDFIHR